MARWTSVERADAEVADLLNLVATSKEPVVVEGAGGPGAVPFAPEDVDRFRDHLWQAADRLRGGPGVRDPDEVARDVAREIGEVRRERYRRRQRVAQRRR